MGLLNECLTGGVAACGACLFSNPLEVVKTRMQLQGELQARGSYTVHYRNVFHAFYMVAKIDGIPALQKGLGPGLIYQFIMNGIRLGTYSVLKDMKVTHDRDGNLSFIRCIGAGAFSGCIGAFAASPMYMVKTQLQSQTSSNVIVGTQHNIHGLIPALKSIYQKHGIVAIWRGSTAAMVRVTGGSAAQLSSFSMAKDFILRDNFFHPDSIMVPICASALASIFVVVAMTPFDVVSTRVYNQPVSADGTGVMYNSIFDVFKKIFKTEGIIGFYKGIGAHYFRLGPHTLLSLVFWDKLRSLSNR